MSTNGTCTNNSIDEANVGKHIYVYPYHFNTDNDHKSFNVEIVHSSKLHDKQLTTETDDL